MGQSGTHADTGVGQGRRSRVAGGFPFTRRVALTERDGQQLTTLAQRENLSVGAYLARLVERHLAATRNPLPVGAQDLLTALNVLSGELRAVLREARAEGVLLNQIARHLNTHPTVPGMPDGVVRMLDRTLTRHQTTTMSIDALLTRADRLLITAAGTLGHRKPSAGGVAG